MTSFKDWLRKIVRQETEIEIANKPKLRELVERRAQEVFNEAMKEKSVLPIEPTSAHPIYAILHAGLAAIIPELPSDHHLMLVCVMPDGTTRWSSKTLSAQQSEAIFIAVSKSIEDARRGPMQ